MNWNKESSAQIPVISTVTQAAKFQGEELLLRSHFFCDKERIQMQNLIISTIPFPYLVVLSGYQTIKLEQSLGLKPFSLKFLIIL